MITETIAEVLVRHYPPNHARLRPVDRMEAHAGFLFFARRIEAGPALNLDQSAL